MSMTARSLNRIRRGKLVRRCNMARIERCGQMVRYHPFRSRHSGHRGELVDHGRYIMDDFGSLYCPEITHDDNHTWGRRASSHGSVHTLITADQLCRWFFPKNWKPGYWFMRGNPFTVSLKDDYAYYGH